LTKVVCERVDKRDEYRCWQKKNGVSQLIVKCPREACESCRDRMPGEVMLEPDMAREEREMGNECEKGGSQSGHEPITESEGGLD
jgi:hypothetical protein